MAAAFFKIAYAVIISRGIRSFPLLQCSDERWVLAPKSLSAGTSTLPRLSVSLLILVMVVSFLPNGWRARPRKAQRHGLPGKLPTRCDRHPLRQELHDFGFDLLRARPGDATRASFRSRQI